MTDKSERRDAKRRQREKGRRMRGNRWAQLWDYLRRNRYWKAGTIEDETIVVQLGRQSPHCMLADAICNGITADDVRRRIEALKDD